MIDNDNITEDMVLACLEHANLRYRVHQKYIHCQCPMHEDRAPSCQIFKNDWFVGCLAGCPRVHITKVFPELADPAAAPSKPLARQPKVNPYKVFELSALWKTLPAIPRDHQFKKIPLEHLDDLGWRYTNQETGLGEGYFIPYFGRTKNTIPFAQVRHLSGPVRFHFWKDAEPIVYGMWELEELQIGDKVLIVEGTSDYATLSLCSQPVVAIPSASFGVMLVKLAKWLHKRGITPVYAGDNDTAGENLYQQMAHQVPHHKLTPPKQYKDWSDFYVAEGMDAVMDYCEPTIMKGL